MKQGAALERYGMPPNVRSQGGAELRLRCLVRFTRAAISELRSRSDLPWKRRLRAWSAGFRSSSWKLYELDCNDPADYLADFRAIWNGYRVNGFYNPVLGNKLVLSRLLAAHGLPHPNVVSLVIEGRLHEEGGPFDSDLPRALGRTLERFPRQVFRPVWSGSGEGVFFLDRRAGRLHLNGETVSLETACALLRGLDRYVVTEFQQQAAYAQAIFPESPNTIRVLTLWDDVQGAPFIAAVVHRFGSARSGFTDHWSKGWGGYSVAVDEQTGALGKAATLSADGALEWDTHHRDTGAAIEGVVIPGLDDCLSGVLEAAGCFPFCPSIGWDVLLTADGHRIIEANTLQGLVIMQVHRPLLRDPRTRAFYRRQGMA